MDLTRHLEEPAVNLGEAGLGGISWDGGASFWALGSARVYIAGITVQYRSRQYDDLWMPEITLEGIGKGGDVE